MVKNLSGTRSPVDLRFRAAARLTGTDEAAGVAARAANALAVLHSLASAPATAPDALALLHELQVHQVELDMQAEELRDSRAELEAALRRQIELYDFQPVACFSVDGQFVIHETNLRGALLLGVTRDGAFGLSLGSFFQADDLNALQALADAAGAAGRAAGTLTWRAPSRGAQSVRAEVGADPRGSGLFVALMEL